MKIKVCGMKYPSNILSIDELPIDLMGFIFYPGSPRFVNEDISASLDTLEGILKVGVFVDSPLKDILKIKDHYRLNIIQLHGNESPELCKTLKKNHLSIIKAFSVDPSFDFSQTEEYEEFCEYFLFDTCTPTYGGSGEQFPWELLEKYKLNKGFFLSGGLSLQSTEELLKFKHPSLIGYDINSRFEKEPGLKNVEAVKQFVRIIKDSYENPRSY